jgi:hypothetical protein
MAPGGQVDWHPLGLAVLTEWRRRDKLSRDARRR